MKRKNVLLLLMVLAGAACLYWPGESAKATPEPVQSGAPETIVMYPHPAGKNPAGMTMKTTIFQHSAHEGRVEKCETCHHTGDPVPCTSCHSVEGKAEGKYVTLERAMHAARIEPGKSKNTPSSCVSCHAKVYKQRTECAGCHAIVTPSRDEAWCASCHNGPSTTDPQIKKLMSDKLGYKEKTALAGKLAAQVATEKQQPEALAFDCPRTLVLGSLSKDYEPCVFPHGDHVLILLSKGDDTMAKAFHNGSKTVCLTCHHRSPASATPPKCGNCHTKTVDPDRPGRPNLTAAYHLQCMGCHEAMKVEKPKNADCGTCHKPRS